MLDSRHASNTNSRPTAQQAEAPCPVQSEILLATLDATSNGIAAQREGFAKLSASSLLTKPINLAIGGQTDMLACSTLRERV